MIQRLAIALLFAVLGTPSFALQGQGPGSVLQGKPPIKLQMNTTLDRMEVVGANYLSGKLAHSIERQKVTISYVAWQGPQQAPILKTKDISESTSYYPTCAAFLSNSLVLVGGKWASPGKYGTVIELWDLKIPSIVHSVDPTTGQTSTAIRNTGVQRRTVVYEGEQAGMDMACAALRLRGKPASALIQFWDSRDVYELDFSQHLNPSTPAPSDPFPISLRLSASPDAGVPFIPELADRRLVWVRGSTHLTEGYTYDFIPTFEDQTQQSPTVARPLTLFDRNRDGTIEDWAETTAQDNQVAGLLDSTQFEEIGLCQHWQ